MNLEQKIAISRLALLNYRAREVVSFFESKKERGQITLTGNDFVIFDDKINQLERVLENKE